MWISVRESFCKCDLLSVCFSVSLPMRLSVCQCFCLSVRRLVCLSFCSSVFLFICRSVGLLVCLYCLYICLSVCLCVKPTNHLSFCLISDLPDSLLKGLSDLMYLLSGYPSSVIIMSACHFVRLFVCRFVCPFTFFPVSFV